MPRAIAVFITLSFVVPLWGQRALTPADYDAFERVSAETLLLSPNGQWALYTVLQKSADPDTDGLARHIWMSRTDGSESIQLTVSTKSESSPVWSPDGKRIAFLSSRGEDEYWQQLWVLNTSGGEAQKITATAGDVESLSWSPDSKRLALVVVDADTDESTKPIVVTDYRYVSDEDDFKSSRRHVYLLTLATRELTQLTTGNHDDAGVEWSPDGSLIAFFSNRDRDWDRDLTSDIYIMEPDADAVPRKLTSSATAKGGLLAWRPDGQALVFTSWPLEKLTYAVPYLSTVSLQGEERALTQHVDRTVSMPTWSADGKHLYATIEDDGASRLMRLSPDGKRMELVAGGDRVIHNYDVRGGKIALITSDPAHPSEVVILDGKREKPITRHAAEFFKEITLAKVQRVSFPSKDGTAIHGFLTMPQDPLPDDALPDEAHPLIVQLHGGPVSQFASEFDFDAQVYAAAGYAVLAVNPRGSSGRGERFAAAIDADWGNIDAQDVLAGVDWAVARGIADPERLAIGGWSYGGMLTNYVIAQDKRFKAAMSGAATGNLLAGFGTDEHVMGYELELGYPWKNTETWMKLSFPFLHADRISTPTLFLAGENDRNVPLIHSQQMYQALRAVGVNTTLIIYPRQKHSLNRTSHCVDRLERSLAWYAQHLNEEEEEEEFW